MRSGCDELQLRARSQVLTLLLGILVGLCLAALAGLFLLPRAAIPLAIGMALALGLWMASYLLEAALSADCVHQNRKMRCFDNGTNQTR